MPVAFWRLFALLLALSPLPLAAQCPDHWLPGPGLPGMNGPVYSLLNWDPDGSGPQPELLFAGGQFGIAGQETASSLATWDGYAWKDLLSPVILLSTVRAMTIFNGELIIGGIPPQDCPRPRRGVPYYYGCDCLYRWDGSKLASLGQTWKLKVTGLQVFENKLIVAGNNSENYGYVYSWDGTNWAPMGGQMNSIYALTIYQGDLIAGGHLTKYEGGKWFRGLVRWDGAAWKPFADGLGRLSATPVVNCFSNFEGMLVIGGLFDSAGVVSAKNLAGWDGTIWRNLGDTNGEVRALAGDAERLLITGDFTSVGGIPAAHIAQWDGANWQPLDGGLDAAGNALAFYGGRLYAGGDFLAAGEDTAQYLASWDQERWQSVPVIGTGTLQPIVINAMTKYQGSVIAGGQFTRNQVVARWNGVDWEPLGAGIDLPDAQVYALAFYEDKLIAGGGCGRSIVDPLIMEFDGDDWHPLGGGTIGTIQYGKIQALMVKNGELIAGGDFSILGDDNIPSYLARWDGINWHSLSFKFPVRALAIYHGDLVAASHSNIGLFNGSSWHFLPSLSGDINALLEYQGDLIAGGNFLARWDGTSWYPLVPNMYPNNPAVKSLAIFKDKLIVGGYFTLFISNLFTRNIVSWDGSAWSRLNYGLYNDYTTDSVNALLVQDNSLMAGGIFNLAGNAPSQILVSPNFAQWGTVAGDIYCDDAVDGGDLARLAANWGMAECAAPGWCGGADLNQDAAVDLLDLQILAANWLRRP